VEDEKAVALVGRKISAPTHGPGGEVRESNVEGVHYTILHAISKLRALKRQVQAIRLSRRLLYT